MKQRGVLISSTTALAAITLWTAQGQTKDNTESYRQWTKVNEKPLQMYSWIDLKCSVTPQTFRLSKHDPHRQKFFVVYVNSTGKNAMLTQSKPKFPVGTVIVKEKLPASKEAKTYPAEWKGKPPYPQPELLTVMRKREKGYFPKGGDWEYSVMDGTGQKTLKTGKLETCAECHAHEKATDYVTRNYLPEKTLRILYPKTMPAPR